MIRRILHSAPGQSLVEFSLTAVLVFGIIFAVFDFAHLAFDQHALQHASDDLARNLASITAPNTSSTPGSYAPTPLTASAAASAYTHAAGLSQGTLPAGPLTATGSVSTAGTLLTNGAVTVSAYPTLAAAQIITVTASATYTANSPFVHGITMHLSASSSAIPPLGQ